MGSQHLHRIIKVFICNNEKHMNRHFLVDILYVDYHLAGENHLQEVNASFVGSVHFRCMRSGFTGEIPCRENGFTPSFCAAPFPRPVSSRPRPRRPPRTPIGAAPSAAA